MFKHLLVPLDGSGLAEAALAPAAYLAGVLGSRVTLIHIVEADAPDEIHGERHIQDADEARRYLEAVSARAFQPGVPINLRIEGGGGGQVARQIQEYASAEKIDLVVMSAHGGKFHHLLSGSNPQQVVAFGTIPVLQLWPSRQVKGSYSCRRILAPLDGKSEHELGLQFAAGLAKCFGAELHLLGVVPTVQTLAGERAAAARLAPGAASAMLDIAEKEMNGYLLRHLKESREKGIQVAAEIDRGDPAGAILDVANRSSADLIVLATHRKSGVGAFWSGSVAPRIGKRSPIPVLLIPIPDPTIDDRRMTIDE